MTKKELIATVQGEFGDLTKKQVGEIVDAVFGGISQSVQGDGRYSQPGFGTFTLKDQPARTGRNPRTNEPIDIPASKTCRFKPAPELKKLIN
ncbi:MAG: HU family DNA-binding protein [Proteobacteria bacterium]|nr:HU family DNA-binding protein [Pseudomonadota bacterium]